ncbi:MAG TPA: formate dehydrogenase accessory sulfurtransferase FdhD [Verrucomicrobiae bacterium]|jgi:FdhD protein|nr:formate dehydrogenase accessory sulfurtransferase FdhD [Verrucomicrobiae bacterium]
MLTENRISSLHRVREISLRRLNNATESEAKDFIAAEEPLEIRVEDQGIAVVMRTPGEDRELAAGFLVTEGIIHRLEDVKEIRHRPHCWSKDSNPQNGSALVRSEGNVIDVWLKNPALIDLQKLSRHVFTSSSCGICSKASIAAVRQQFPPLQGYCEVDPQVIRELPEALAAVQETFKRTGGLHACALFDLAGRLLALREDVGRHNALDKIIGWALLEDRLPLSEHILLLSGRTSFEMMQKSLAGGVPIVAAISAPSSLAVEFARDSGQTLVGFLRGERMNIYAGANRIRSLTLK